MRDLTLNLSLGCPGLLVFDPGGTLILAQLDVIFLPVDPSLLALFGAFFRLSELSLEPVLLRVRLLDSLDSFRDGPLSHLLLDDDASEVELAVPHVLHVLLVQLLDVELFLAGKAVRSDHDCCLVLRRPLRAHLRDICVDGGLEEMLFLD